MRVRVRVVSALTKAQLLCESSPLENLGSRGDMQTERETNKCMKERVWEYLEGKPLVSKFLEHAGLNDTDENGYFTVMVGASLPSLQNWCSSLSMSDYDLVSV